MTVGVRSCSVCKTPLKRDYVRENSGSYARRSTCFGCKTAVTKKCPCCEQDFTIHRAADVDKRVTCGKPDCVTLYRKRQRVLTPSRGRGKAWSSRRVSERAAEEAAQRKAAEGDFTPPAIKTTDSEAWLAAAGGIDRVRARALHYTAANDAGGPLAALPRRTRGLA